MLFHRISNDMVLNGVCILRCMVREQYHFCAATIFGMCVFYLFIFFLLSCSLFFASSSFSWSLFFSFLLLSLLRVSLLMWCVYVCCYYCSCFMVAITTATNATVLLLHSFGPNLRIFFFFYCYFTKFKSNFNTVILSCVCICGFGLVYRLWCYSTTISMQEYKFYVIVLMYALALFSISLRVCMYV